MHALFTSDIQHEKYIRKGLTEAFIFGMNIRLIEKMQKKKKNLPLISKERDKKNQFLLYFDAELILFGTLKYNLLFLL